MKYTIQVGRNKKINKMKRLVAFVLVMALTAGYFPSNMMQNVSAAKSKSKLNASKITMEVGKKRRLTLKKAKQKVKWSVVSGKSFVKLSRKTGKSITLTAKKKGKATVQAKCGNQKYKCKITIVNKAKQTVTTESVNNSAVTTTIAVSSTVQPNATQLQTTSTEQITTQYHPTTEAPATETKAADLSKYGTITKKTINGITYNILTNPTDAFKEVERDQYLSTGFKSSKCSGYFIGTITCDINLNDYGTDYNFLELMGKIQVIDDYGIDVSNNVFLYEYYNYNDDRRIYFEFVDSKGVCLNITSIEIFLDFEFYSTTDLHYWNYKNPDEGLCMSYIESNSFKIAPQSKKLVMTRGE